MPYSTCCGAHTTMPEIGICPDCLDHCDWEDESNCCDECGAELELDGTCNYCEHFKNSKNED